MRYTGSSINGGNGQGGLFQNIQQSGHGVQCGEHGHVILGGNLADLDAVILVGTGILGVDHVSDVALTQCVGDLLTALADLGQRMGADAVLLEELSSTLGGFDVEAQLVEAADQGQSFVLVLVSDGGQHRAVILQMHAGCLQCLIERTGHGLVVTDGFAGGLHFGGQVSVQTADLVEGEDGSLDVEALLLIGIDVEDALFLQALAEDHFGSNVSEAVAGGLAQEGNGTGGTGVDLDDEHVVILVYDELDVEQTHDADAQTQLLGILQDLTLDLVGDGEGGVDGDGVAGVDTGALDQLHDAGNEHIAAVTDGIDLNFAALNILVDQNGLVLVDLNGGLQIVAQLSLVGNDLHGAAAQNEGGATRTG